jgi:hypothetical protein
VAECCHTLPIRLPVACLTDCINRLAIIGELSTEAPQRLVFLGEKTLAPLLKKLERSSQITT